MNFLTSHFSLVLDSRESRRSRKQNIKQTLLLTSVSRKPASGDFSLLAKTLNVNASKLHVVTSLANIKTVTFNKQILCKIISKNILFLSYRVFATVATLKCVNKNEFAREMRPEYI